MNIAILGAGVAGVSTAIALRQQGFDVCVYERHPSISNLGAGIVIWPNASFVLEQLGVSDEIEAVSGRPTHMLRVSSANEALGGIDIQQINRLMGYPSRSILRSDFQHILTAKLESLGVAIQYGREVTGIHTADSGEAIVQFRAGSDVSADVIVGADGRMYSIARQYVHGSSTPVYQGFINWVGVFESIEETFEELAIIDYWGVGARFGIVPVTRNKAYWAGGTACAEIGPRNPAEYKEELTSVFSEWPARVLEMIQHTPIERMNKIYVHDHDPISIWHKHNLITIGDAAHAPLPTSGQGACQALEDAWHLANALKNHADNLQKAFTEFTGLRYEKTANIITTGRSIASSLFNQDAEFCEMRNEQSKHTDYAKLATAMAHGWAQHLPLPV